MSQLRYAGARTEWFDDAPKAWAWLRGILEEE